MYDSNAGKTGSKADDDGMLGNSYSKIIEHHRTWILSGSREENPNKTIYNWNWKVFHCKIEAHGDNSFYNMTAERNTVEQ